MEIPETSKLKDLAASKRKVFKKTMAALKKKKRGEVDRAFHELHDEAFSEPICLSCANCCKTTSPIFKQKDIDRVAKLLRMAPGDFVEKYLRIDNDGDYVLQTAPCPFLGEDNYCGVYEARPKACREYPHTDRKNMPGILNLTLRNTSVCPAVFTIMERLSVTK